MSYWEVLSQADLVIGLGTFLASAAVWLRLRLEARAAEKVVRVLLVLSAPADEASADTGGPAPIELPLQLRARDLTRAELLGRIGMLPMRQKGSRFAIRVLSRIEFLQALEAARRTGRIEIPVTREEIDQFDL